MVNIDELPLRASGKGSRFAAEAGRIGSVLGMQKLGAQYMVVPPGKSAYPRHCHHANEEMFVVLEGTGTYGYGDTNYPVRAGDVLSALAGGAETAHQLTNTGAIPLRYLSISTRFDPDILEYPDSGKLAVASGIPAGQGMVSAETFHIWRRDGASPDYWDGEDIGEQA